MTDEEYLQQCMNLCEVEEINHGHRAVFLGVPAVFQASGGPDNWTRDMARKAALFFWALEQRDKRDGVETAVFI